MNLSKLQANIDAFREFIQNNAWSIIDEKEIQYGFQLRITDGITKVTVAFFNSGKVLIQGKPGELQTQLKSWWYSREALSMQPVARSAAQSSLIETPTNITPTNFTGKARIGLDESGKGDYFGPLVIGAVFVDGQTEERLITLGVRDSKLLSDNHMLVLAEEIKALCPHFIVPIEPKRYNELYAKVKNLNRLLAWGHAWALESLLEKVSCDLAIVDKFGDESYVRAALKEKGRQITLIQQTHAEADIAVAAASILARARFVQNMEQLSKKVGKTLPKGASDPSIVVIGSELVAEHSKDILVETAKLHFKTTEAILQS
ncbi:MAG TPA: ribonuclease HIII [Ktedonobacteraceae bacterium]|nr:ribonuclease HIII [Ktedonobacteraceae bacterium]